MNKNFKSSKSARNDLESVLIGPKSVPVKFKLSRVSWRRIMGLIHCPNFVQEYPRFLYQFRDSK